MTEPMSNARASQPTFEDRQLYYRVFGYWPGEAPREPDDLRDAARDSRAEREQLTDAQWRRLGRAFGVYRNSYV